MGKEETLSDYVMVQALMVCDDCGKEAITENYDEAEKYFYGIGWRVKKDRSLCPQCAKLPTNQKNKPFA